MFYVTLFCIFTSYSSAQNPATAQEQSEGIPIQIDCTKMPDSNQACQSFNDLANARDSDVLTLVRKNDVYVCLRANDDIFSIIALDTPGDALFSKSPTGSFRVSGLVSFVQFNEGQADQQKLFSGTWVKFLRTSPPIFMSSQSSLEALSASDAEINVNFVYRNIGGGKTNYSFQMRRSTLRAKETLQWHNPSKDPKHPAPDTGSVDFDGHCVPF